MTHFRITRYVVPYGRVKLCPPSKPFGGSLSKYLHRPEPVALLHCGETQAIQSQCTLDACYSEAYRQNVRYVNAWTPLNAHDQSTFLLYVLRASRYSGNRPRICSAGKSQWG